MFTYGFLSWLCFVRLAECQTHAQITEEYMLWKVFVVGLFDHLDYFACNRRNKLGVERWHHRIYEEAVHDAVFVRDFDAFIEHLAEILFGAIIACALKYPIDGWTIEFQISFEVDFLIDEQTLYALTWNLSLKK